MLAGADDETRICVYLYTCNVIPILFLKGDSIGWDSWATATLVLPTVFSLLHYRTRKRGQLSKRNNITMQDEIFVISYHNVDQSARLHDHRIIIFARNIISPPQAEIFWIFKGITILECIFSEGIRDFQRSKSSKFPACGGLRLSFSELRGVPSRLRNSIGIHKI